jgi:hypothetical protein
MAITETNLPGNGTAGPFTYTFPALEAGDIYVSVDGVVKTVTTDYSLNFVDKQITFLTTPYPTVSNVIRIYRVTDDADLAATFYSGAAIRATDLNTNFTQGLYVTQESNREAATAISTAGGAVTTANAATATANSAVSTANAATATANTALSNSSAAVSTANTASSNASAAVSTANTASSNATTAVSTANAATATANSAASDAATAISTANSAVSTANTASTTATNAVNTANSASSAASSAVSTANTASSNASAAVSTANTASSNATSAVNTANSALSTANAAASAVANAILYDIVANVAAIPASPANNDAVEVTDSTGIESFTPLTSIPGGFAGNSGLSVRIVYTTTGNTWTWIQYFPNDPETRYLKEAVTTSDTAPVSPSDGDLWYDSVGGRTYVYYDDGAGSQWVDTSPQGSGVSDAISEGNTSAEVIDTGSDGRFVVTTEGSERLRITSAGNVGIGTSAPGSYNSEADDLVIYNSGDGGITIATGSSTGQNKIYFAKGTTGSEQYKGYIVYNQSATSNGSMVFGVGGSNKVAITEAGNVGIGTTTPNVTGFGSTVATINVAAGSNGGLELTKNNVAAGHFTVESGASNDVRVGAVGGSAALTFQTGGAERARITSAGLVGIGTSNPGSRLELGGDPSYDATIAFNRVPVQPANDGVIGELFFQNNADSVALIAVKRESAADDAYIQFATQQTTGGLSEKLRITSAGRVGIGTTSPSQLLHLSVSSGVNYIRTSNGTVDYYNGINSSNEIYIGSTTIHPITFRIGDSEKTRIDTSGRLLVGTSTEASNNLLVVEGSTTSDTGAAIAALKRGTDVSGMSTNDYLGILRFTSRDSHVFADIAGVCDATPGTNDYPGRLVFSTTADGASGPTERMRITRGGDLFSLNADNGIVSRSTLPAGTANTIFAGQHSATSIISGTNCFRVYTNGNVQNTNNSYGALSDIKLKENIVDANSQWDDLKALQVRNYNFKEGQTHTQIGLVAQEAELVSPGLVTESPDCDEDGNDLGTVTKSVNYSVLYMKAVKALQEAMTRIETLEAANTDLAARLTALEGGTN